MLENFFNQHSSITHLSTAAIIYRWNGCTKLNASFTYKLHSEQSTVSSEKTSKLDNNF